MRRLLWVILAIFAAGLFVMVIRNAEPIARLAEDYDLSTATIRAVMVIVVGAMVFVMFRHSFVRALEAAVLWVVIALVLAVGYTYRFELQEVADRVMAELVPGRAASRGRTVEISRSTGGSFSVATHVNGARVPMLLDTGASAVVLTQEAAKAAGLPLEVLNYSVSVDTANGRTRAAPVTLDRISVGGITERAVPALIAQPGQLRSNLLGMSFLNRLDSWEVRGDKLLLRGQP